MPCFSGASPCPLILKPSPIPSRRATCLKRNGPDNLVKLLKLCEQLGVPATGQDFFVLGRVRMRMGFHWKPLLSRRRTRSGFIGACPHCGHIITNLDGEPISTIELEAEESRRKCSHCASALWTLMRPRSLSTSPSRPARHPREPSCCASRIFTAEYDVLCDEGEAYGAALQRAGVPIHCKRWDGQIHDFTLMAEHIADAETALREADEALRLALHAE